MLMHKILIKSIGLKAVALEGADNHSSVYCSYVCFKSATTYCFVTEICEFIDLIKKTPPFVRLIRLFITVKRAKKSIIVGALNVRKSGKYEIIKI